ncbi:MAG: MerR family transcriptional regulator [Pseudomonadota bacterium]
MAEYNIKSFCNLAGINEHTLRAWERRYGVVDPNRSLTNRRLYSEDDLDRVRLIVTLVERGHGISQVATLPLEKLRTLVSKIDSVYFEESVRDSLANGVSSQTFSKKISELVTKTILSLSSENPQDVRNSIKEARLVLNVEAFLFDFVTLLLHQIGEYCFHGKLRIWQEHQATEAVMQELYVLSSEIRSMSIGVTRGPRPLLLITTIEGNHHKIATVIASIAANLAGLEAHFLGPHLPARDLSLAMKHYGAQCAVVGIQKLPPGETQKTILEYATDLRNQLSDGEEIWIGGPVEDAVSEILSKLEKVKVFTSLVAFRSELERLGVSKK